jgi:hypothetical protein
MARLCVVAAHHGAIQVGRDGCSGQNDNCKAQAGSLCHQGCNCKGQAGSLCHYNHKQCPGFNGVIPPALSELKFIACQNL